MQQKGNETLIAAIYNIQCELFQWALSSVTSHHIILVMESELFLLLLNWSFLLCKRVFHMLSCRNGSRFALQPSQVTISSGPVISAPPKPTFPAYSSGPKPAGAELAGLPTIPPSSTAVQKVVKPAQGANGMKMKLMHPDEDISLVSVQAFVLFGALSRCVTLFSISFPCTWWLFSCVSDLKVNRNSSWIAPAWIWSFLLASLFDILFDYGWRGTRYLQAWFVWWKFPIQAVRPVPTPPAVSWRIL